MRRHLFQAQEVMVPAQVERLIQRLILQLTQQWGSTKLEYQHHHLFQATLKFVPVQV